ncbi:hypothetical protein BH23CHL5_BH23CHL5_09710 [soil metagenome]
MLPMRRFSLCLFAIGLVMLVMPIDAKAVTLPEAIGAKNTNLVSNFAAQQAGTYTSPDYGYNLTWDGTWQADEPTALGGRNFLRLRQEGLKAELIGEAWEPSEGTCFDAIADDYGTDPPYSQVVETVTATSDENVITGSIAFVYTSQSDSTSTDYVIEVLCAPTPGSPNAVVMLKQTVLASDLATHAETIADLQAGFALNGEMDQAEQISPTPTPTVVAVEVTAPTPAQPTAQAASPSNRYVSPTYGFSFTWDDSWQVTDETSENGLDILSLDNGRAFASLYGETWVPGSATCIDWNVQTFSALDVYSDVEIVESTTSEGGQENAVVTLNYWDNGNAVPFTLHLQCSPLPSQPNAVVTLSIFVQSDFAMEQEVAIAALAAGVDPSGGEVD